MNKFKKEGLKELYPNRMIDLNVNAEYELK